MKKIIFTLLSLLIMPAMMALPIGNPVEPAYLNRGIWFSGQSDTFFSCLSGSIGYYGDFVFNRNLQVRRGTGLNQGRVINESWLRTNAAYLSLSVFDRFEAFAALGKSHLRIHTRETSWFLASTRAGTLFASDHFSWSVGGRALLLNWRCFSLGVEGQYFSTSPQLTKYISEGAQRIFTYLDNAPTRYSEWQIGGALSYSLKLPWPEAAVIPYVGIKGSRVRFTTHNFTFVNFFSDPLTIFALSAHKHLGYAVGATLVFGSQIGITIEGRFADERAVHVKSQICF